MAYNPNNPNGQATMANSQPVVLASNQSPVSVAGTVNVANPASSIVAIITSIPSISGTVNVGNLVNVNVGGSVLTVGTAAPNQSVSGTVGASIIGTVPVVQSGIVITSISGTVGASIIGTVPVTQSGTMITSIAGIPNINIASVGGAGASSDAGNTNPGTLRVVQGTATSFNTSVLTVGTTITSIIAANANRIKLTIVNNGTSPLYIGTSGLLTTGIGQYVAGIAGYPVVVRSSASIFGIAAAPATISFLEEVK